ncbi:MAG: hypothetical protein ABSG53_09200 [Thermoguttaceae bacterium]|jgi:hypothetical protein
MIGDFSRANPIGKAGRSLGIETQLTKTPRAILANGSWADSGYYNGGGVAESETSISYLSSAQ